MFCTFKQSTGKFFEIFIQCKILLYFSQKIKLKHWKIIIKLQDYIHANTLERIQSCENVVGRDPEGTIGEESKTPCDSQNATQSHYDYNIWAIFACFYIGSFSFPEKKEPGHYDDEGTESEDEDQSIVAYVDNVVDIVICYPAPWNRKIHGN